MTLDEFYERLEIVAAEYKDKVKWYINDKNKIRGKLESDADCYVCPISMVAAPGIDNDDSFSNPVSAGQSLGLLQEDARMIALSADNSRLYVPNLIDKQNMIRAKLIEILIK